MARPIAETGAALIIAIVLIVVMSFLGIIVVSLVSTHTFSALNEMRSTQALGIADGGLERTVRILNAPPLAQRISCAAVTGNANLTTIALGDGMFTVTADAGSPFYRTAPTTLTAPGIAPADTTIAVGSTAGYAPTGRIMIDRELIDYGSVTAGAFTNAIRGVGGTTAAAHATGTRVGQYQCAVSSQGGVPNLTAPIGKRVTAEGIQLEAGFAGGKTGGGDEIFRWNSTASPNVWTGAGAAPPQEIRGVDMLSYADGWAVGKQAAAIYQIFRWNGGAWALACTGCPAGGKDLEAVSAVTHNAAWTIGKVDAGILHWDGVSWHHNDRHGWPAATTLVEDLKSIEMISCSEGWAVGKAGTIYHYRDTGATPCVANPGAGASFWHRGDSHSTAPNAADLEDLSMLSATSGWAVGNAAGGILHWNGATWHNNDAHGRATTAQDLRSIHMVSSVQGWAVGKVGIIYHYDGVTWHTGDVHSTSPTILDLNEVFMFNGTNGWAVGKDGVIIHWDGSAWSTTTSPTTADLKGLSLVRLGTRPQALWREMYR